MGETRLPVPPKAATAAVCKQPVGRGGRLSLDALIFSRVTSFTLSLAEIRFKAWKAREEGRGWSPPSLVHSWGTAEGQEGGIPSFSPDVAGLPAVYGCSSLRPSETLPSVDEASANPSKSCRLFGVTMEKVFYALLGFLFCPSALLVKPFVHFHPLQLNLTEGETAKFTCSISNPDLGKHLDWYKQGHDRQPVKLDGSSRKYSFAQRDERRYEMEILQVEKNDSGTYYCWVNPFHSEGTMLESNRSSLIVTENVAATQPPDEIAGVKEQDEDVRKDTKSSFSDLRGSGLFILLVVLYFLVWWIIRRRRQKQKEQKHGNAPLEEVDPPAVTVFTVDYEMLAFPGGPKTKPAASPKPVQREPTEYATIVFLPKTPEAAEEGDSKQTPCPVCVQQP